MANGDNGRSELARLERSQAQHVVASDSLYRGVHRFDLREWSNYPHGGEHRPTKKGISLTVDELPAMIVAMQEFIRVHGSGNSDKSAA